MSETVEDATKDFIITSAAVVQQQAATTLASALIPPSFNAESKKATVFEKALHAHMFFEEGLYHDIKDKLDTAKRELDAIPEKVYYVTRDRLFPLAHSGANVAAARFQNRAGHKLNECMEATGMFRWLINVATAPRQRTTTDDKNGKNNPEQQNPSKQATSEEASEEEEEQRQQQPPPKKRKPNAVKLIRRKEMAFVDVCGGPGAFSQALYASCPKALKLRGFGITLMDKHVGASEGWYPELREKHHFRFTFGVDGTGDIYKTENLFALRSLVQEHRPLLVVADGGFEVPSSQASQQEVISARIVYAQWLSAVMLLDAKGCFVLKLFDVFSPFSHSLLYLSTLVFEKVHIVKPRHSRVVNSERYLACLGFKPEAMHSQLATAAGENCEGGATITCLDHLINVHAAGFDDMSAVRSLVPLGMMEKDEVFQRCLNAMIEELAQRQMIALRMILSSDILKERMEALQRLEQMDQQEHQQHQRLSHAADGAGEHERKRERQGTEEENRNAIAENDDDEGEK